MSDYLLKLDDFLSCFFFRPIKIHRTMREMFEHFVEIGNDVITVAGTLTDDYIIDSVRGWAGNSKLRSHFLKGLRRTIRWCLQKSVARPEFNRKHRWQWDISRYGTYYNNPTRSKTTNYSFSLLIFSLYIFNTYFQKKQ